jgi:dTDP-4-amino-4,6-dideoxygalactose transaminase
MRKTFLPFSPPLIGEAEIAEVVDTLRSDWITTGPKVRRFESDFAKAVGAPSALALSSCTAALEVALATLKIGPGDSVITTAMTFCSTLHAIEHSGATPILVDVEPETLNLNPARVRERIDELCRSRSHRVRAIVPVHLYGHPCDMDALFDIASSYDCAIVEDAAHGLPAHYKGHVIGSMADTAPVPTLTCFSFYATKNMTTAEGGMLTGKVELIDGARVWALHGMSRDAWKRYSNEGSWRYDVLCPGFKCNMTDIQAALGLHQLRRLSAFHERRSEIAIRYTKAFGAFEELETPGQRAWAGHAWHLYVLRLNLEKLTINRDQFITELHRRNIGTSVHFIPIHLLSYYREKYRYSPNDFPITNREFQRVLSLPCSPAMSDEDVNDVIAAVTEVVNASRARKLLATHASAPISNPPPE